MKQHITPQDLDQLTDSGKQKMRDWWKPQLGDLVCNQEIKNNFFIDGDLSGEDEDYSICLPLLSIGQLIQFLDEYKQRILLERNYGINDKNKLTGKDGWSFESEGWDKGYPPSLLVSGGDELCDALWSAVVAILNKE